MKKRYEALVGLVVAVLIGIGVGCAGTPPVRVSPPNMSTTTIAHRPRPSPLSQHVCWDGYDRCFIWRSPRYGTYIWGSIQYAMWGTTLCDYRPDLGDTYYSEPDGTIGTPPKGCPDEFGDQP